MAGKDKKPEIRFAGFTDAWKQRKVGEIVTDIERPIIMKDDEVYQLVTVKRRNEGVVSRGFLKGRDILVKNYFEIRTGDYIVSKRQVIHGGNGIVPENLDKSVVSNEYLVVISNDTISAKFWTLMSKRREMYRMFFLSSYGVDIEKMVFNVDDWKKRTVTIPSMPEQNRIIELFESLDNLITLHQRKYDKLVIVKKSMLEKMFPKEGSNVPEIRFSGFSDAWEQRELCDIANKVTEKNVLMEYSETFTNSAEYGIVSQRDYFDHDISNSENIGGYYIVQNEDFVYNPRISSFAPVGPINRNKLGRTGVMSPLYTVFRTHDIDNTFLEQFLKSNYWHTFMRLNGDSGARSDRFSIKDSIFMKMPIPYPSVEEQVAIGKILTTIDNLITFHQRELEKLKNIKKSMLEKMFM
jgi:type I restriction enzyme, S subunit